MTFTPASIEELVQLFGGALYHWGADTPVPATEIPSVVLTAIRSLSGAQSGHLSFLSNAKYRSQVAACSASAVMVSAKDLPELLKLAAQSSQGGPLLWVVDNPYLRYALVQQWWVAFSMPPKPAGIHPSAIISPDSQIHPTAAVGPNACVGSGCFIAAHSRVGAGTVIGDGVQIGEGTLLHANVTVYDECVIGNRVIIHSGAVIGADGFGFAPDRGTWVKIPQVGRVVISDDVEIGANTTIDRGALEDTLIGVGVKLDNQIQIAHNVVVGEHTAMAGCVGIAGSAVIGARCTIGGAAMILGHLSIADGSHVSSGSVVMSSIKEPGAYSGFFPLDTHKNWERTAATLKNITELRARIRALEKAREP